MDDELLFEIATGLLLAGMGTRRKSSRPRRSPPETEMRRDVGFTSWAETRR